MRGGQTHIDGGGGPTAPPGTVTVRPKPQQERSDRRCSPNFTRIFLSPAIFQSSSQDCQHQAIKSNKRILPRKGNPASHADAIWFVSDGLYSFWTANPVRRQGPAG